MKKLFKLASITPAQPVNTQPQPQFPAYGGIQPVGGQILKSKPLKPIRMNSTEEYALHNKAPSGALATKTAREIVSEYLEKK